MISRSVVLRDIRDTEDTRYLEASLNADGELLNELTRAVYQAIERVMCSIACE